MKYLHPAVMATLFLVGLLAASRGGPARMVRLRGEGEPATVRRHRVLAAVFAALVATGYGGGLVLTDWLLPFVSGQTLHFQMGTILLGLLALVVVGAVAAHRGVRWALHLHPLLATAFLLLYLVQAAFGLGLLGYELSPPERPAAAEVVAAACEAPSGPGPTDEAPPLTLNPQPDVGVRLAPFYAICPQSQALPAPSYVVRT